MDVDEDTLRSTGSFGFNATMAPTFTQSKKRGGKPNLVTFRFKGKGLSTGINEKNIDPNQTVDTSMAFFSQNGSNLEIASNGNLYSPIDGSSFLNISGGAGSVKPLILELEIPIFAADPDSGIPVQTGVDLVTRTFDNIPKLVIMDDEFNVYFIEPGGIKFDGDGYVDTIVAKIVNTASAPKMKFSREEVEVDSDGDGDVDDDDNGDTIKIFDFPQLYFFDMRQAGEQLEQFCSTASINSFPFQDNDADEIEEIVEEGQSCLTDWLAGVRALLAEIASARESGTLPLPEISVESFEALNEELVDCLGGTADRMCRFVINSLNSSFKVLDDDDNTPLPEFTVGDISEEVLEDFDEVGPAFTGAREYAAGIGDSASVSIGTEATIELIPRDAYDEEVDGDYSDRITLEIVSDDTGAATFIRDDDGNLMTKNGNSYTAKLTSTKIGEVRIRARICDRTIQALTFDGIDSITVEPEGGEVDCVSDGADIVSPGSSPLGALTKVDRILSVFFTAPTSNFTGAVANDAGSDLPVTNPQKFGTGLEN